MDRHTRGCEIVEWDGSLFDKARWFFNLLDALPEDSKFFRLIETATVLTDAKIAVLHPDHARIHLERSDAPGSIDAPCMYMRNSFGLIASAASEWRRKDHELYAAFQRRNATHEWIQPNHKKQKKSYTEMPSFGARREVRQMASDVFHREQAELARQQELAERLP